MVHAWLFWAGTVIGILVGVWSFSGPHQTKIGVVAFPFMLLAAAVVAKFLDIRVQL